MRTIDCVVAGFGIGVAARIAGVRLAAGTWSDTKGLPFAGRTVDPSGVWVRLPGTPRALIVFRGRGSCSLEAERLEAERSTEFESVVGTPTVMVEAP